MTQESGGRILRLVLAGRSAEGGSSSDGADHEWRECLHIAGRKPALLLDIALRCSREQDIVQNVYDFLFL